MASKNPLVSGVAAAIAMLVVVPFIAAITMIPAALWYCFDDTLAAGTGQPWLGTVPFLNMWAFTFFVSMLFKSTASAKSSK